MLEQPQLADLLTPLSLAEYASEGRYARAKHLELIEADVLDTLQPDGPDVLVVQAPPRHGKSQYLSRWLPTWFHNVYPEKRSILTSYGLDLARGHSRWVRDTVHQLAPLYGSEGIKPTVASATDWQMANGVGGMKAAGVGGSITGIGADCVAEGSLVETLAGSVRVEELQLGTASGRILSYNHRESRLEYQDMQAIAFREAVGLYRITTNSGRVLEVTGNHRIYARGEYRTADTVSAGDTLLLAVQKGVHATGLRVPEVAAPGACRRVLLEGVQRAASLIQECEGVQGLPKALRARQGLLRPVQAETEGEENDSPGHSDSVRDLQRQIPKRLARRRRQSIRKVLRQAMRGNRSQQGDDWQGQSEMERRSVPATQATALREGLSRDATLDRRARRARVRYLQGYRETARSPHRQLADEQFGKQPDNCLREPSQEDPRGTGCEAVEDTVSSVERIGKAARVYDLQVKETSNFFAEGILVHNCFLVDDYLKNAEQAISAKVRDAQWEWFQTTAFTRLEPGGKVFILATRWHEMDLIGQVLKFATEDAGLRVRELRLPALAEPTESTPDPLGRQTGEALWPERWPVSALERIRDTLEPYWWNALYQQRLGSYGKNEWPSEYFYGIYANDDEWPSKFSLSATALDPSKGKNARSGDYSAIVTVGFHNGYLWVDADLERRPVPKMMTDLVAWNEQRRPTVTGIEAVAFQELLASDYRQAQVEAGSYRDEPVLIENTVNKNLRIGRLGGWLRKHQIKVRRTPGGELLVQQMKDFPNGKHEDGADCLEMSIRLLMQLVDSLNSPEQNAHVERYSV